MSDVSYMVIFFMLVNDTGSYACLIVCTFINDKQRYTCHD